MLVGSRYTIVPAPRAIGTPWRSLATVLGACTLRTRLFAVIIALNLVAALLTGTIVILTGRAATAVEVDASMRLAGDLVNEAARAMQDSPPPLILRTLQTQFASIRHVDVVVLDLEGRAVVVDRREAAHPRVAPRWFSDLVGPVDEVRNVPLLVRNRKIGDVRIVAEPKDEIGEAWHYAQAILLTGIVLNALILGLMFLVLGRLLQPLSALIRGLSDLEARNYAVRLGRPSLPELAAIAEHFNKAAATVGCEQENNRLLNRKLVAAQDGERRRMALDLHDEVGPCLFALDACTSAMAVAPRTVDRAELARSAEEATALVRELKAINRRVLGRLRPPSLGRTPLADCLRRLVRDLATSSTSPISIEIEDLRAGYGPTIDLTIYRCVQEGVFNAMRHAQANVIVVTVEEAGVPPHRRLLVHVSDDGNGLASEARAGLGLAGLRERVEALSGAFEIGASAGGTRLSVALPLASDGECTAPHRDAARS